MTYSRNTIYDFKSVTEKVELAREIISTQGWGKLYLELLSRKEEVVFFELYDVAYVPTFARHRFPFKVQHVTIITLS